MKGLCLKYLRHSLHYVDAQAAVCPMTTIKDIKRRIKPYMSWIEARFGKEFNFKERFYLLPWHIMSVFTFEELCKLHNSTNMMLRPGVRDLFDREIHYDLFRKIGSSMWRWGSGTGDWNEMVDAYEGIRNFKFIDSPDFEIRLDHAVGHNECGHTKYARVFIDGALAFLVYYKGKHVMTIGFSIMAKHRILIQQVQSAQRSGNRYLFKLPANRMEFVINLFRKNFPDYEIFVVDGKSLLNKIIGGYSWGIRDLQQSAFSNSPSAKRCEKTQAELQRRLAAMQAKIDHVNADGHRLISFYGNTGCYKRLRTSKVEANGLTHLKIVPPKSEKKSREAKLKAA